MTICMIRVAHQTQICAMFNDYGLFFPHARLLTSTHTHTHTICSLILITFSGESRWFFLHFTSLLLLFLLTCAFFCVVVHSTMMFSFNFFCSLLSLWCALVSFRMYWIYVISNYCHILCDFLFSHSSYASSNRRESIKWISDLLSFESVEICFFFLSFSLFCDFIGVLLLAGWIVWLPFINTHEFH